MTQLSPAVSGFGRREFGGSGFERAWFLLTEAFALHVLDEAAHWLSPRLQPHGHRDARALGMVPHADIRVSPVAHRTEPSRLILPCPHARSRPRPTMAAASRLVLCPSHVLEWRGTHRVYASRTHAPFGVVLAPGGGILLVAIAFRGLYFG
jgi:hypothetical protein